MRRARTATGSPLIAAAVLTRDTPPLELSAARSQNRHQSVPETSPRRIPAPIGTMCMSTSMDTGKTEVAAKSAETNKPIGSAPLAGKIAIVTGGGRGMGRSMVLGLARAGAKVIATAARERQELERVVAEAPRAAVVPIVADVTDADNCAELVAETLRRFGKLDILVNNAGRRMRFVTEYFLTEPTHFCETNPKAWRLIIDTNVNGPFFMARAAAPPMIKAGWGPIINHSANFFDDAAPRLLSLRAIEGGARI